MDLPETFGTDRPVIGMVHLPALPGAPCFDGDRESIRDAGLRDARALEEGGIDGLLVENYGDVPFYPDSVPKHVVADMTALVAAVGRKAALPVGVNVLRNDAGAALSIAAATGARYVRVNVHTAARVADQGIVEGRAHETMRLRERLAADVAVLADVDSKHSAPLSGSGDPAEAAIDAVERGLADGVIVSGTHTGEAVDEGDITAVVERRDEADLDVPVLVGSGVTAENAGDLLSVADGAIVGTALKEDGRTRNPVDPDRVRGLVEAARG